MEKEGDSIIVIPNGNRIAGPQRLRTCAPTAGSSPKVCAFDALTTELQSLHF